jgi:hypothetical protein
LSLQASDAVGLSLRGFEVDEAFCKALKLRVLHMERGMQPSMLPLNSATMQWLGVGATTSEELRLRLRGLPTVSGANRTVRCATVPSHHCSDCLYPCSSSHCMSRNCYTILAPQHGAANVLDVRVQHQV